MAESRIALITGASGFVARHLAKRLKAEGYDTIGVDIVDSLPAVDSFFKLDCADKRVEDLIRVSDEVYHLAGNADTRTCETEPKIAYDLIHATDSVCYWCLKHDKPLFFSSSGLVYGYESAEVFREDDPIKPPNIYAITKRLQEEVCAYYQGKGLQVSVARFFNIFGEKQDLATTYRIVFIHNMIRDLLKEPKEIILPEDSSRDFIYIQDAVTAIRLLMQDAASANLIYNVATGKAHRLTETLNLIAGLMMSKGLIHNIPKGRIENQRQIPLVRADITKLLSFGFHPYYSFMGALSKTIDDFVERYK